MTECKAHPGPEEWRPVVGAQHYEVSNRGAFRSIDRTLADGRKRQGQPIATRPSNKGYMLVDYTTDAGKRVTRTVHTVELEAFCGPRPAGQEACHANDVQTDNCWPENLRWAPPPDNTADRRRNHPARPPRPARICVRCQRNPVTRGGKRCHACVVELGEQAADLLKRAVSVSEACELLGYPSGEGLMRLAERYGGYGVPDLPGDTAIAGITTRDGHGRSRIAARLLATLRSRRGRGDAA